MKLTKEILIKAKFCEMSRYDGTKVFVNGIALDKRGEEFYYKGGLVESVEELKKILVDTKHEEILEDMI